MTREATPSPDRLQQPVQLPNDPATRVELSRHRGPPSATPGDETARASAPRRKRREPFVL